MFFKHALARSIYRTCYFYALFEKEKYIDLDAAMVLGLQMSLEDLRAGGITPHENTVQAFWILRIYTSSSCP